MKRIIFIIIGIVLALLGLLWFLQGAAIIHVDPVLCVAECEPVEGVTPSWIVIGLATFIVGVAIGLKNLRTKSKGTN